MPKKEQDLTNVLAKYANEFKDMLESLAIKDNNETFVTAHEAIVTNANVYSVTYGEWLTNAILPFVTQHFQSQFDPQGSHVSLIGPAECQWISSVNQHQVLGITDRDCQRLASKKILIQGRQ